MTAIREPAVAGLFYPGGSDELGRTVRTLLDEAAVEAGAASRAPKAVIAPHAGYIYSGPVAARAYTRLAPYRERYSRVVLLGPCHRVPVRGFALPDASTFRTPLGDVPLDTDAIADVLTDDVVIADRAHAFEHCLEVHLPFLQTVLGEFSLVPIVVGHVQPERVADLLEQLWGGPETLIVISSDLSHYLAYDDAQRFDAETCRAITELDWQNIDHDHACGATPVTGLLIAAERRGLSVETLDLRNSGDTSGDRGAVVGYGAWEFLEK